MVMEMFTNPVKPRLRVKAGTTHFTNDSFQNFSANLGYQTNNVSSGATYGFNPISRERQLLEWAYRGSWLVRKIVDCPADDMTREGIAVESDMPPDRIDKFMQHWSELQIWLRLNAVMKWARLYGGAVAVIMIEGQAPDTPLRIDAIGRDQFKGLIALDRWMVWPQLDTLVKDYGANYGTPEFYKIVADTKNIPQMTVHHTRIIRFDGIELPYWQKISENNWGISIIEPLWDRLIAFDSVTQGAAQLVYKAHLRVLKLPRYRELIATGGVVMNAVMRQLQLIRTMQTNEGLTVLDGEDAFETNSYSFAGLSDMMVQFSQQVSGAADVPMTRLFGQSPAGMNSTGESDLRNYYDGLKSQQEMRLRQPIRMLLEMTHRSLFGATLPEGFNFSWKPLWQMTEEAKAGIATQHASATDQLLQSGVFSLATAMKEIRQSSRITGFGSNITDEDLESAEEMPPPGIGGMLGGEPSVANLLASGEAGGTPSADPSAGEKANEDQHLALGEDESAFSYPAAVRKLKLRVYARGILNKDRQSIIDVHGIQCVIETAKGESRSGYGWSNVMPCHYGYISGTSSTEGDQEQMDCFIGDDLECDKVWIIDQLDLETGKLDEHKVMLGFSKTDDAENAYIKSFDDGRGAERIGGMKHMIIPELKTWLKEWQYGSTGVVQ